MASKKPTHNQEILMQIYEALKSELGRSPTWEEIWDRYDHNIWATATPAHVAKKNAANRAASSLKTLMVINASVGQLALRLAVLTHTECRCNLPTQRVTVINGQRSSKQW
jgi:hypothetical protein